MVVFPFSCTKKEDTNPCAGVNRTQAAFKVSEALFNHKDWNYETDTIGTGIAIFTVTSEADSVKWLIGAGVYTNKEQLIQFGNLDKTFVPVTLIIFRKPRTDCFADDKSSDTLTKMIYVAPSATKVYGNYLGYWKEGSSLDTFRIKIYSDTIYAQAPYVCVNLNKKNNCIAYADGTVGYRKAILEAAVTNCDYACNPYGYIDVSPDGNTITINYATSIYGINSIVTTKHTFIGTRQP